MTLPIDKVMPQRTLLCTFQNVSKLYSRVSGWHGCSEVDTVFLAKIPAGKAYHYSNKYQKGFCLCMFVAPKTDTTCTDSPLSLVRDTEHHKLVYHMSAGDTCIITGMWYERPYLNTANIYQLSHFHCRH